MEKPDFDLSYRPETYWPELNRRLGRARNAWLRRLEAGEPLTMPPMPFALRGGDFLPGFLYEEREVARLELNSTLCDVISVRVRKSGKRMRYRAVDEYENRYELSRTSCRPLTMQQIIDVIDGLYANDCSASPAAWRDEYSRYGQDIEKGINAVTVTSDFYPQLCAYYAWEARTWAIQMEMEHARSRDEHNSPANNA
jgi:hypothetical protein